MAVDMMMVVHDDIDNKLSVVVVTIVIEVYDWHSYDDDEDGVLIISILIIG